MSLLIKSRHCYMHSTEKSFLQSHVILDAVSYNRATAIFTELTQYYLGRYFAEPF